MSVWNKYGTVKEGRLNATFYFEGEEVDYAACYALFNRDPVGDKFDEPMTAAILNNRIGVVHDGKMLAALPADWTRFVGEVVSRGPIAGTGFVRWIARDSVFQLRFDIAEG